ERKNVLRIRGCRRRWRVEGVVVGVQVVSLFYRRRDS
ncbi:hypothetical protein CSUI_005371, partial [Cystoisospora suis]